MTRETTSTGASAASGIDGEPTVVLKSTFLPSGEVAHREYHVKRDSISPGNEPEHWPVLAVRGDSRLLLDIDDLRAVWTGSDSWDGDRA